MNIKEIKYTNTWKKKKKRFYFHPYEQTQQILCLDLFILFTELGSAQSSQKNQKDYKKDQNNQKQ